MVLNAGGNDYLHNTVWNFAVLTALPPPAKLLSKRSLETFREEFARSLQRETFPGKNLVANTMVCGEH